MMAWIISTRNSRMRRNNWPRSDPLPLRVRVRPVVGVYQPNCASFHGTYWPASGTVEPFTPRRRYGTSWDGVDNVVPRRGMGACPANRGGRQEGGSHLFKICAPV